MAEELKNPHRGPGQGPADDRRQPRLAAGRPGPPAAHRDRAALARLLRRAHHRHGRQPAGRGCRRPGCHRADARRPTRPHFVFDVATGPRLSRTDLAIQGPPDIVGYPGLDRSKLTLAPGKPADATLILATEDEILGQVKDRGYALAGVARREVLIDHATREAHVTFVVEPGRWPAWVRSVLRHREGRHHLPAAPGAVRAGRSLHAGQGERVARPPDRARRLQLGARQARHGARRQG